MKQARSILKFALLLLMATAAVPGLQAQVCPNGNGGGSGSGGGGATLMTITVDGNPGDWGAVLANPLQVTNDGEWVNCSTSTDKDYVYDPVTPRCETKGVTGRDLAVFAWTYDTTVTNPTPAVYLYVKRFGSSTNTQTFYFYMDTNSNQRMNTGEKVYQVLLGGSNRKTTGTLYNYTAVDGTNGDPLVAPAGSTYPGYADGYTLAGSLNLASETLIYADVIGGFADGTGFEAYLPWTNIGTPAGTAIYFHVSSTNSSNPAQVPASLDDNLGGIDGKIGAFAFQSLSVTPDHSSAVTPGSPTIVWYPHVVANTGTLPDSYLLTTFSSLGLRVDLYASDQSTLLATDLNGNGSYADPGDQAPSPISLVAGASGYYQLWVKITAPSGVSNVQDTTTLSAFSQTDTDLCASAKDTTAIGELTLAPTPQAKSVVAGQQVDYSLALDGFIAGDDVNLNFQYGAGWTIQVYTDPDGDGDPADGVLVTLDGSGNALLTPTGPPFHFVVRLTAPAGATPGTVDTCTVLAQDLDLGVSATATLTSTVRTRLTLTPNYTVAAGTNKYSGQGQSVFYAHTIINSWPSADSITFSTVPSPTAWTIRYWTDPNADGNPDDGTLITGATPLSLAANGGTEHIVVEVVVPTGLSLPYVHTDVVTATGGSGSADAQSVTDEVRVSYVATYSDANRTLSYRVFALCQTIYTKGSSLTANSSYTFRYLNPSSTERLTETVTSDGNGEALSQYTLLSSDDRGNWTIELRNASNTLVDSIIVFVDPPIEGNLSTVDPLVTGKAGYALTGDNLSITATFNNTSTGADYTGTTYKYLVRTLDRNRYLTAAGSFAAHTPATLMTRTTSPHTVYHSSSDAETVTINNVQFPSAGVYAIDVIWEGSCSNTIASTETALPQPTTLYFPVGTTLASYADAAHTQPEDYFRGLESVYMHGLYYLSGTAYKVAYYGPDGALVTTHTVTSTGEGGLSDSAVTGGSGPDGTWHAVVYLATLSPPPFYNSADPQATSQDWFVVDTTSPTVTVDFLTTTATSPQLTGTVNDPTATVTVTVNGNLYTAVNNGDGTWTLPAGTIAPALVPDVYDVVAIATDLAGNTGSNTTSDELTIQHLAPEVTDPILAGASSISGTSPSPDGTEITIYSNGTPIGTATVTGGAWTLINVSGLAGGESITAIAGEGTAAQSAVSNPVVVSTISSIPPIVSSSLLAGSGVTIYGSSVEAPDSVITVYLNGFPLLTQPVVQADGTWSLPGVTLMEGDIVKATVLAPGKTVSNYGNQVIVSANPADVTPPPVITSPIPALSTSVSGTSLPNAVVDVYADGFYLGTVTADGSGNWTLTGVPPLAPGTILSATATLAPGGTSNWSAPVVVGDIIHMLRSDKVTSLTDQATRVSCFDRPWAPLSTSLDPLGAKHRAMSGEGVSPQPGAPDTADGDKSYILNVQNGQLDPEVEILTDDGRPLVFYELFDNNANTLFLTKEEGRIEFTWTAN